VTQVATTGASATSLTGGSETATAKTVNARCTIKTTKKGKRKTRTFTCTTRLTKGTWTLTTQALAPTTVVARAVKVFRVK
jgi:hypothetical protein